MRPPGRRQSRRVRQHRNKFVKLPDDSSSDIGLGPSPGACQKWRSTPDTAARSSNRVGEPRPNPAVQIIEERANSVTVRHTAIEALSAWPARRQTMYGTLDECERLVGAARVLKDDLVRPLEIMPGHRQDDERYVHAFNIGRRTRAG